MERDGYALLPDVEQEILLSVAQSLGNPVADTRNTSVLRDLSPREQTASPANTLSSRYGLGAFPFHTETAYWRTPARFVILYCVNPGAADRPTLLLDLFQIWNRDELSKLERDLWIVHSTRTPFLCKVIERTGPRTILRYDPECMRPARPSPASLDILVRSVASDRALTITWKGNDLLIVDNHRILHARAAAQTPDPDRRLQRVLIAERERR